MVRGHDFAASFQGHISRYRGRPSLRRRQAPRRTDLGSSGTLAPGSTRWDSEARKRRYVAIASARVATRSASSTALIPSSTTLPAATRGPS